jgi:1-acyl-sn-glycerol-3-phosphate acyltransferase
VVLVRYAFVGTVWKFARFVAGKRLVRGNGVVPTFTRPLPQGPFLLLANHAHALDPYVIGAVLDSPVRYMANLEGVSPVLAACSGLGGAFGKRKGMPDLSALRTALQYLKDGEPVGIFPEGDRSWDGKTATLNPGIARLAKIAAVPIVLARQRGSYLTFPRWATVRRKGLWTIDFSVIEAGRVASLTVDALTREIQTTLDNDDLDWASASRVEFSCKAPASGMSRALWACPHCGSIARTIDDAMTIRCLTCGSGWVVDANCGIRNKSGKAEDFPGRPAFGWNSDKRADIQSWMHWQRAYAANLAGPGSSRRASVHVSGLSRLGPGHPVHHGPGMLSVSSEALLFKPDSAAVPITLGISRIEGFIDNFNRVCEFSHGKERWQLDHGSAYPLMWIDLVAAARNRAIQ